MPDAQYLKSARSSDLGWGAPQHQNLGSENTQRDNRSLGGGACGAWIGAPRAGDKLIRVCEQFHHWAEARFLYRHNDEFDNAIKVMVKHPAEAWEHETFKDILTKVKGVELCYQAIHFYVDVSPSRPTPPPRGLAEASRGHSRFTNQYQVVILGSSFPPPSNFPPFKILIEG